jgi:integrase
MKGSIRKRGKGSWSVIIDLPRDPQTGKRRQQWHTVHGTKKDAERELRELLHSVESGTYVKPSKLTVAEFLEGWLEDYVMISTAPRTAERYEEIVRVHLIPALGSLPVTALRPEHIQRYYTRALESGRRDGKGGLSPLTVHHYHRVLYEALKYGVRHGILVRNVAEAVDPPRPESKQLVIPRANEVQLILNAAEGTPYYALFFTIAYTGMRRSEALGLRWCDVNLETSTISVTQTLHQLRSGEYIFREPKNKHSKRQIALPPSLAILLWQHQLKQEHAHKLLGKPLIPKDLVFSHPDGRPLRPNSVTRAFQTIADSVGLRGARLHNLRHAHATILLQEGVHPKIVQERLGHSSVSTTLDIYSHVMPGLQEAAARKFEEGLQGVSAKPETARVDA